MPTLGKGWNPLRLKGLAYPKLWYRFDYPDEYDREVLVWHVRTGPKPRREESEAAIRELKYGMNRSDCGRTWRQQGRDKDRLRKVAEGELGKDLCLLERKLFPRGPRSCGLN